MINELCAQTTIVDLLAAGARDLEKHGNPHPRREAEYLLGILLDCERAALYARRGQIPEPGICRNFEAWIRRRSLGEPLQYITRKAFFFGLEFFVAEGIFIPRPETEVLAETALALAQQTEKRCPRILELCTGCGNIAAALTKNLPECRIIAVDVDPKALAAAADNACRHNVRERITLVQADLFGWKTCAALREKKFDAIVVNPPYIPEEMLSRLPREVRFEPENALNGGKDGLKFYRLIAEMAPALLSAGGFLAVECGDAQAERIAEFLNRNLIFEPARLYKDLNGINRVLAARRKNG